MKKPLLLLSAIAIAATAYLTVPQIFKAKNSSGFNKEEVGEHEDEYENEEEEEKETGADKQLMMWFQQKGYPDASNLAQKYMSAWEQAVKMKNQHVYRPGGIQAGNWTNMGQVFNGGTQVAGRIVCIEIDPNNSNNLWAGSASGGIWKSTNAGNTWTHVETGLPVLGVSTILVDPANSNTIYAGTGEVYRAGFDNVGFNVWKARGTYGIGIIKSTDGGVTWSQILVKPASDLFGIQKMKFDPTNSNTIYACATDGVYRSTNNGSSWNKIYTATYVNDIVINPSNTNQVVVSTGNLVDVNKGIYRSTNANNASPTFSKVTSGLPASFTGSIKLDNAGSGLVVASIGISSGVNNEIFLSTNFGSSWTTKANSNHCEYQFWFAHTVAINPFSPDSIMYGGVDFYRSSTSGSSRSTNTTMHSDHHYIKFDPVYRGRVYVCNDGGIYKSTNGGSNFTAINNGLNAIQFYASLGVSKTNANRLAGGLQDNGQVIYNGTQWNQVSWAGGDGTSCAIRPDNDNYILVSRDAKQVYRSTNGGSSGGSVTNYWGFAADSRTAFVAPLAFSQSSPTTVYLASDNLHKSTNSGTSFTNDPTASNASTATNYIEAIHKTAIALAVSPTNANKVYVSTSPFAQYDNDDNRIYVTGQPNILKTTTGNTPFTSIKGTLPDRFVTDIAISNTNDDSVFITLGGFGTSHIYVTGNGGTSWTSRGAGLPDVPFNAIVIDPVNPNIIYAGCDFGVYVSADRGLNWIDYNSGFWDATLVMDLQITADNKLVAATHGKGAFKADLFDASTLPVRLIDFSGVNRGNYNELHWTVSQEQDLSKYELERSTDGINYSRITTKAPSGSASQITYTHNDPVLTGATEFYYRLKIVDNDGKITYSSVIFIRTSAKTKISVLNNPFTEVIALQYNMSNDAVINIGLYNASGALVRKEQYKATAGTGTYTLYGVGTIPPGIYFLRAEAADFKQSFKLLKN